MDPVGVAFVAVVLVGAVALIVYSRRAFERDWSALAEEAGGRLERSGGLWKTSYALAGVQDGVEVRLEREIVRRRTTGLRPPFKLVAVVEPPSELVFSIKTAAFSGGGRKRGIQFHGDEFDATFIVESPDEARMHALFTPQRRSQVAKGLKGTLAYDGTVASDGRSIAIERVSIPRGEKLRSAVALAVSLAKAVASGP